MAVIKTYSLKSSDNSYADMIASRAYDTRKYKGGTCRRRLYRLGGGWR